MKYKKTSILLSTILGATTSYASCQLDVANNSRVDFTCDNNTNLTKNNIEFKLFNGAKIGSSIWSQSIPNTWKAKVNQTNDRVSINIPQKQVSWWPKDKFEDLVIPAGSYSFGFNQTGNGVITDFHINSQPQERAILAITLPQKPASIEPGTKPNVKIFSDKDILVAELKTADWGTTNNLDVPTGKLNLSVSAIGSNKGKASPSSLTISKDEIKNINVSYEQAQVGSISLSASTTLNTSKLTTYIVKDTQDNIVAQGELDLSTPVTIDNLPASDDGIKYTIYAKDFADQQYNYSAEPVTVTVRSFDKYKKLT